MLFWDDDSPAPRRYHTSTLVWYAASILSYALFLLLICPHPAH